jgi:transcriptional regulator with XRE-family HTH domain
MGEMLGEVLRTRRLALGLSLRHVAREANISPAYLVALEHGRNPTTRRPPMPSPRVLAALGGALGIGRTTLLAVAAPPPRPVHVLVYQTGAAPEPPTAAARLLFGDAVDGWVEVVDPHAPRAYAPEWALATLEAVLAERPEVSGTPRLGLVFGAGPRVVRRPGDLGRLVESEATWETDVAEVCQRVVGAGPVANVCVYRERVVRRREPGRGPLTSGLALIRAHQLVAVQDADAGVTTGPPAIERILTGLAPAEAEAGAWRELAQAAAIGLAGDA